MLLGCAVIATDVGGNPEAIHHRKNGLLVPPGDKTALADAINELLTDDKLRCQLAATARQEAENTYAWPICLARYQEYYASALHKAGYNQEAG